MAENLTITAPDFDWIKKEAGVHTMDGIRQLWSVANDEDKSRRTGIRLAIERQEVKTLISSLLASQDNFDTKFSTTLRFDGAVAVNITGIRQRVEGARIRILVLGTGTITLKHNDAASEAQNRMLFFAAADKAVATNKACELEYQSSRWREISLA
jgi:hypothetical protein